MSDKISCVYRYFLFGFDYDFNKDVQEFRAMQNRTSNRTLSSINHILLKMQGLKYRQPGITTTIKGLHDKAFEIVRFMAKYS